jgi:hypothetical protein
MQGPGLFEPIHGSAPDIAGQVEITSLFLTTLWRWIGCKYTAFFE